METWECFDGQRATIGITTQIPIDVTLDHEATTVALEATKSFENAD